MDSEYVFNGFDWTELAECWGADISREDEVLKKFCEDCLLNTFQNEQLLQLVATDIRNFLEKLSIDCKKWSYSGPLWDGLRAITDNETLIQYTRVLLDCMWS